MSAQSKTPVYLVYCLTDKIEAYPPLALGLITAYVKVHKEGILNGFYEFVPKLLTSPDVAREAINEHGPGVFLSSDYMWSSSGNLGITKLAKELTPDSVIIHGGPSVPKYDSRHCSASKSKMKLHNQCVFSPSQLCTDFAENRRRLQQI